MPLKKTQLPFTKRAYEENPKKVIEQYASKE